MAAARRLSHSRGAGGHFYLLSSLASSVMYVQSNCWALLHVLLKDFILVEKYTAKNTSPTPKAKPTLKAATSFHRKGPVPLGPPVPERLLPESPPLVAPFAGGRGGKGFLHSSP